MLAHILYSISYLFLYSYVVVSAEARAKSAPTTGIVPRTSFKGYTLLHSLVPRWDRSPQRPWKNLPRDLSDSTRSLKHGG